jgi:DNA-binding NarL/FixJ family response regulator
VIRVVVADDQDLVRAGFRAILSADPEIEVVADVADGAAAVAAIREHDPDVALVDVRMPRLDGIEATRRRVGTGLRCRGLMLTTFDLDEHVYDAFRAGATGFLLKTVSPEALTSAVRAAHHGEALLAPELTRRLVERFTAAPARSTLLTRLTSREADVLGLVARGLTNAEIAEFLHLGHGTVKTHIGRILAKLDARDRVQLVVLAFESGLVRPGS